MVLPEARYKNDLNIIQSSQPGMGGQESEPLKDEALVLISLLLFYFGKMPYFLLYKTSQRLLQISTGDLQKWILTSKFPM